MSNRRTEWTTARCHRALRPLKSKITAFKAHYVNFPVYRDDSSSPVSQTPGSFGEEESDNDNDSDSGSEIDSEDCCDYIDSAADRSLNVEDNVISYRKCKKSYKRRKVVDKKQQYSDPDFDISFSLTDRELDALDSWNLRKVIYNDETWKQLEDIMAHLTELFSTHWNNDEEEEEEEASTRHTSLRLKCAFKLGIYIGVRDKEIKNIEDKYPPQGAQVLDLYEEAHVVLCRKWVMLGHALGYFMAECPLVHEVLDLLVEWAMLYNIPRTVIDLFVQETDTDLFPQIDHLKELADGCGYKGLEMEILKRLAVSKQPLTTDKIRTTLRLIRKHHGTVYLECLSIIAWMIEERCIHMENTHSLVESLHTLKPEQHDIIELLSKFASFVHPRNRHNLRFLTSVFHSCKRGYRSLIPVLQIIKLFMTQSRAPPPISASTKVILRTIFKPSYKITPSFIRFTKVKSDESLLLSQQWRTTTQYRRSKISTGDLI